MAAAWTTVEETAVHKNCKPPPPKEKIRLAKNIALMSPPSTNPIFSEE